MVETDLPTLLKSNCLSERHRNSYLFLNDKNYHFKDFPLFVQSDGYVLDDQWSSLLQAGICFVEMSDQLGKITSWRPTTTFKKVPFHDCITDLISR